MTHPWLHVLAGAPGDTGAHNFLSSKAGTAVVGLCGAVGVLIIVFGVLGMVRNLSRGRPGDSFKVLLFGLLIGGMLFDLNLTIKGADEMSTLIGNAFDSVGSVTKG